MNKELSFNDIEMEDVADDTLPTCRIVRIIDEIEFLKEDEETEITLSSLGLE